MALTRWNPIPTYTARHSSRFKRGLDNPYRIPGISGYLENSIGWEISAENADSEDIHLIDIKVEGGDLTFHIGTIANEITEHILLTAKKGDITTSAVMYVNIWEL